MDIFDAVKKIYSRSANITVLMDSNMKMIWNNVSDMQLKFNKNRISAYDPQRKITETTIARYDYLKGKQKAIKIEPLYEGDEIVGYLGIMFETTDVAKLTDNSDYIRIEHSIENEFTENLMITSAELDAARGQLDSEVYRDINAFFKRRLRNARSYVVNREEISYYNSAHDNDTIINASDILRNLIKQIRSIFISADCDLEFFCDKDIFIVAKERHLCIAVINLITNAYKYNDKPFKQIKVTLTYDENFDPVLTVSDNGIGLDKSTFEKAVKPFCLQGDDPNDHISMGLSVVKMFCDDIGAKLSRKATSGKGTEISITMEEAVVSDYTLRRETPTIVLNKFDAIRSLISTVIDFD